MQPNAQTPTSPQTPSTAPVPTTDNVTPVGPVLVENVPIVQQGAAPAAPISAAPLPAPITSAAAPAPQQPTHQVKPRAVTKSGKHKTSDPNPWLVIFLALVIAVVLTAFALKAYK